MTFQYSFGFVYFTCILVACSGSEGGARSDVADTSPSGTSPEAFCARSCIAEDRDRCMPFATRFSDAFLEAYEACGDDPACVRPKLDAAPRTERQMRLAVDYCSRCESLDDTCASKFWTEDGAGSSLASFSDARLDAVDAACVADATPGLACRASFAMCVLPFLQEDLANASFSCRQRR